MDLTRDSSLGIDALCAEIVQRYHASVHRSLARIRENFAALSADGAIAADRTRVAFEELAEYIVAHLAKEEALLFPALESLAAADREGGGRPMLPFTALVHPIRVMEAEHMRIEELLARVRDEARAVAEPESLQPRWRECMSELALLDSDLREHHRTENEVLFPRALDLERRLL